MLNGEVTPAGASHKVRAPLGSAAVFLGLDVLVRRPPVSHKFFAALGAWSLVHSQAGGKRGVSVAGTTHRLAESRDASRGSASAAPPLRRAVATRTALTARARSSRGCTLSKLRQEGGTSPSAPSEPRLVGTQAGSPGAPARVRRWWAPLMGTRARRDAAGARGRRGGPRTSTSSRKKDCGAPRRRSQPLHCAFAA